MRAISVSVKMAEQRSETVQQRNDISSRVFDIKVKKKKCHGAAYAHPSFCRWRFRRNSIRCQTGHASWTFRVIELVTWMKNDKGGCNRTKFPEKTTQSLRVQRCACAGHLEGRNAVPSSNLSSDEKNPRKSETNFHRVQTSGRFSGRDQKWSSFRNCYFR